MYFCRLFLNQQHGPKVEEDPWKQNRPLLNFQKFLKYKVLSVSYSFSFKSRKNMD